MLAEIVIAGSGGQGVLVIGRLLAEAGFLEGHEVLWSPSYGAEKRGGTVVCYVTISDEKIGAFMITRPTIGIAMNLAAGKKMVDTIKAGGILVVNENEPKINTARKDIRVVSVAANRLAQEMGNESTANIIMLGALLTTDPIVSLTGVEKVMEQLFGNNPRALDINKKSLAKGAAFMSGCI
jgi:2-oxoglutarate ferredoxin oxidoreductase subunit gamma